MNYVLKKCFKISNPENKDKIFKSLQPNQNKIDFIQKGINMLLIHTIENETLAEINALSHSQVQNKLFKNRLEKRIKATTTQFRDYN